MKRRIFIQTIMIGSGSVLIGGQNVSGKSLKDLPLRVLMIYNNIGKGAQLASKWGLSIIIENNDDALLFDTGGEPEVLWQNIQKVDFDIRKISKVVISHNHWDHVNGLSVVIEKSKVNPKVYVPQYELKNIQNKYPGAEYIGVNEPTQLNKFAWTTGQLTGKYKENPIYEQSIIISHNQTIYLFTGCSHPGIVNIVEKTKSIFPEKKLKLVAGGFHMNRHSDEKIIRVSDKLNELKVEKIGPSHCTGDQALNIFKKEWKKNFIDFNIAQNELTI